MKQPRAMPFREAIANVLIGYAVAACTQMLVFPWLNLETVFSDALGIGAVFTDVRLLRATPCDVSSLQ